MSKKSCLLAMAITFLLSKFAIADPVTYLFTFRAGGSINGQGFEGPVVLAATGNSAGVTAEGDALAVNRNLWTVAQIPDWGTAVLDYPQAIALFPGAKVRMIQSDKLLVSSGDAWQQLAYSGYAAQIQLHLWGQESSPPDLQSDYYEVLSGFDGAKLAYWQTSLGALAINPGVDGWWDNPFFSVKAEDEPLLSDQEKAAALAAFLKMVEISRTFYMAAYNIPGTFGPLTINYSQIDTILSLFNTDLASLFPYSSSIVGTAFSPVDVILTGPDGTSYQKSASGIDGFGYAEFDFAGIGESQDWLYFKDGLQTGHYSLQIIGDRTAGAGSEYMFALYDTSGNPLFSTKGLIETGGIQSFDFDIGSSSVPEPTSLLLLGTGLGVIGLAAWRKRK